MLQIIIEYITVLLSGYLIGSIPWAYIIGKLHGIDIRQHGSRNVGATNATRVLGKRMGVLCFFLDFLKGFLPILALQLLQNDNILDNINLDVVLVALATVAGHMWPLFLKFKGGKGISTIAGIILALAPFSLLVAGGAWVVIFHISRYVSLASVFGALILPLSAWGFAGMGWTTTPMSVLIMLSGLALLAILRHSGNIKRLLAGTENKFERKLKI